MKTIFKLVLIVPAAALLVSCHKEETVNISKPLVVTSQGITSDTLSGSVKGSLISGKIYYFRTDITVNSGDTLFMQPGARLIALGDGASYSTSPQITVNGTLISNGTQEQQNWITVPTEKKTTANIFKGFWGGIQCSANSGNVIIRWTHIEYVGGPAGPANDPSLYTSGSPRYGLVYSNIGGSVILEDSWITASKDDGMRVLAGQFSIMRNTFEANGESGGESFNCKSGAIGDIGYNVFMGAATNGCKISNAGGTAVQCNTVIYNNTFINCGFRQVQTGRGGSINYEKGAKGMIYNNMIVNCRYGPRLTTDADLTNIAYDNQYFYATSNVLYAQFYPPTGVATAKSNDIRGTAYGDKKPLFATYTVDGFDYGTVAIPMSITVMPAYLYRMSGSDFRPTPGSPMLNKGKTGFQPLKKTGVTGPYVAAVSMPGADIGAYQNDGSGNLH